MWDIAIARDKIYPWANGFTKKGNKVEKNVRKIKEKRRWKSKQEWGRRIEPDQTSFKCKWTAKSYAVIEKW